jgi:hypothetical protein
MSEIESDELELDATIEVKEYTVWLKTEKDLSVWAKSEVPEEVRSLISGL